MKDLDPSLIHRVLLTDPSDFPSLTVSGWEKETPSYEAFAEELSSKRTPAAAMRAAYRDHITETVLSQHTVLPLQRTLLDLHTHIRRLVPNRQDLHHTVLNDQDVRDKIQAPDHVLGFLQRAAQALVRLESAARATSTQKWCELSGVLRFDVAQQQVSFLLTSALYLLLKTELCQTDKQNFFLSAVLAPRIAQDDNGVKALRRVFENQHGALDKDSTAPLTQEWIRQLVNDNHRTRRSREERQRLVRRGWVRDILFRDADSVTTTSTLLLPEVFMWESDNIRHMRQVHRRAAAGSALALRASTQIQHSPLLPLSMPQQQPPNEKQQQQQDPIVTLRRKDLLESMLPPRGAKTTQKQYEQGVADAVIALAKAWKETNDDDDDDKTLDDATVQALRNRTESVLRGEDAVMKLLDRRSKEVCTELVLGQLERPTASTTTAAAMRTGRRLVGGTEDAAPSPRRVFVEAAQAEFAKKGLAFFAKELAECCYQATKIMELAERLFGDLIDRAVLRAYQSPEIASLQEEEDDDRGNEEEEEETKDA